MPLTLVIAILVASTGELASQAGLAPWRWLAVAAYGVALALTVTFNVPVNLATAKWDRDNPHEDWKCTRDRWERFQGARSWLLLIGFVFTSIGFAAG